LTDTGQPTRPLISGAGVRDSTDLDFPEALREFVDVVSGEEVGLLDIAGASAALEVDEATVLTWIAADRLLGWPKHSVAHGSSIEADLDRPVAASSHKNLLGLASHGVPGDRAGATTDYWIPKDQFLGPHRLAPGIAEVLNIAGDAELAWAFLDRPWLFGVEGDERPIERLRRLDVESVISAARSFAETVPA